MPHIYGQLLNAQMENSSGNPASGGTPTGRVYLDITNVSAAVPKFYNGTSWVPFGNTLATNNNTSAATFNTNGNNETIYNTGSGTLSACTITLPATSLVGQVCRYATKVAVTTVTMSFAGSLSFGAAVTSLSANGVIAYMAVDTAGTFIRIA